MSLSPVIFVKYFDKGSTVLGAHQMGRALQEMGFESRTAYAREVGDVRDSIPIPIARLIQRALAKQPGQRYQSAADLRQDLADIRRDMDTGEALSSGLYSGSHAAPRLRAPSY